MKKLVLIVITAFLYMNVYSRDDAWSKDATPLYRSEKALTDVIIHDIFSPPVASRIYAYANISAYEVLVKADNKYRSLHGVLKDMPPVPEPRQKISASLAAVYAFMLTGKKLVFSEHILEDSLQHILSYYKANIKDNKLYTASLAYGQQVSDTIMAWVAKDQYKETRKLRRYNLLKQEGKWIPTPPGYIAAVEPNWNKIRPLVMDSCNQFPPVPALAFSKEKGTPFYEQAYEVYTTVNQLTDEQRAKANFWDCNPFFLNTEGHLNFATKKISPGGHWISITGIVARQTNTDITKASMALTLTSIALFDAFISCWDEKYRSNLIRPETYINAYIDESWRPILQTPPFPEYTSGHSVISTAVATVLTKIFGDNVAFDDDTEVEFGLMVRHFNSFKAACDEAAVSRLYGGIHYRAAVENGQKEGGQIGNYIIEKVVSKILTTNN